MKYRAIIPFIPDMGSINPIICTTDNPSETAEENVLWEINSMRDHDGLRPLKTLPKGVEFVPLSVEEEHRPFIDKIFLTSKPN